jgi:uncharacterized membrane protein YhhN
MKIRIRTAFAALGVLLCAHAQATQTEFHDDSKPWVLSAVILAIGIGIALQITIGDWLADRRRDRDDAAAAGTEAEAGLLHVVASHRRPEDPSSAMVRATME